MSPSVRARCWFVLLALTTVAVGLTVHRRGVMLPAAVRDVTGDALWAMMIAWGIGAIAPRTRASARAVAALVVCWAVELGQLVRTPLLDGWRGTTLGHLVLGSDFDPRDLGAYALGVGIALLLESRIRRRHRPSTP